MGVSQDALPRKDGDRWLEGGLAEQDGGKFICNFESSFGTSEVIRLASISAASWLLAQVHERHISVFSQ